MQARAILRAIAGFRDYNPVYKRFDMIDPLTQKYPELTPYQFASNTPIAAIDLDGLESNPTIQEYDPYLIDNLIDIEYIYDPGTGIFSVPVVKYGFFDIQMSSLDGSNFEEKRGELMTIINSIQIMEKTNNDMYQFMLKSDVRIPLEIVDDLKAPNGVALDGQTGVNYNTAPGVDVKNSDITYDADGDINGATQLWMFNNIEDQEKLRAAKQPLGDNKKSIPLDSEEAKNNIRIASISMKIDRSRLGSQKKLTKTMAHETGHAFSSMKNKIIGYIWSIIGNGKGSKGAGHEKNNPSGKEAEKQEKIFEQNSN